MRVRFLKTLIDTAERQSMQRALVSLQYEVVVTAPHRDEDVRIPGNGIYRIEHGKVSILIWSAITPSFLLT